MDSLRELAEILEPDHYLAWQAEVAKPVDRTVPKTVESVEKQGDIIRVDATGDGEGKYHFTVDGAGNSESFYHDPSRDRPEPLGSIIFAELTDSRDKVPVRRGYHDSRLGSD